MTSNKLPTLTPKSVDEVRAIYQQEAAEYQQGEWFKHLLGEKRLRRELMAKARGKTLDVACGTGENFPYFPLGDAVAITAVELSSKMLERAQLRAQQLKRTVTLLEMNAQQLEFADASFDTVASAMSTCTFPDPVAALREMGRVCKPDGRILLLEHGRSRFRMLAGYQDRNAHKQFESQGCRWNQDPFQLAREAGLRLLNTNRALAGIYYVIEAAPAK